MPRRSLWPREHGAYFQLAVPLLTACLVRPPQLAALALALGAILAFLANEPLLVVLGHRGPRLRAAEGRRARVRLAILVGGAVVLGTVGLARAPLATLAAAAIACVPAIALVAFAWRRAEHTLAGELVAAVALTGAALPVLVANGGSLAVASALWAGWALGFGAMVVAIHRVLARHKRRASWGDAITVVGLLAATLVALAVLRIAVPLVALATLVALVAPSAARLRAIGIATAVVAVLAGVSVLL